MGAWGVALFSDDTAADVRFSYRALQGRARRQGGDRSAVERLRRPNPGPRRRPGLRLALAAVQTRIGLLEDRVRSQALAVIDSGTDLARWETENPKLVAKRRAILDTLRAELLAPQRPPRKIRPYQPASTPFERGRPLIPARRWALLPVPGHRRSDRATWRSSSHSRGPGLAPT